MILSERERDLDLKTPLDTIPCGSVFLRAFTYVPSLTVHRPTAPPGTKDVKMNGIRAERDESDRSEKHLYTRVPERPRAFLLSKSFQFMSQVRHSAPLVFLVTLLVLSGCRTYGGYDTQAKNYEALQNAVQSFEADLNRAQADLQTLEEAASTDTLEALAGRLQDHIHEHEELLQTQKERLHRLSPETSYRALQRAYGATVKEQNMIEQNYQRVVRTVQATVQETDAEPASSTRRYTIAPVNFPDSEDNTELTMERALQGR